MENNDEKPWAGEGKEEQRSKIKGQGQPKTEYLMEARRSGIYMWISSFITVIRMHSILDAQFPRIITHCSYQIEITLSADRLFWVPARIRTKSLRKRFPFLKINSLKIKNKKNIFLRGTTVFFLSISFPPSSSPRISNT